MRSALVEPCQRDNPIDTIQMNLSKNQIQARKFYFAQLVADYFAAFGAYPKAHEFRPLFIYATRKAASY